MNPEASTALIENIRVRYRTFAEREEHGVSPRYEQIAYHVAESDEVLRFLCTLPRRKQQPNLLLGSPASRPGRSTPVPLSALIPRESK